MQLSEGLVVPVTMLGRKRYALGFLPIGDEFLAWSKTAHPSGKGIYPQVASRGWRMGLHGLSLGAIGLLFMPWWAKHLRAKFRRRRSVALV
jgi:hypothetical protein